MARALARLWTSAGCLALVLLVFLLNAPGAWAHAVLRETSPAAESAQAEAPREIALTFNEPVQVLALRLIDTSGRDCSPPNPPEARDGRVLWTMHDPLPAGRYLVSWRVGSLDGHVIGGSFTFAVGTADAGAAPAAIAGTESHWAILALHALARLTLLFAVGTALFRVLLAPATLDATLRGATRWLALAGIVTGILFIGADGALRAGLPATGLLSGNAWHAAAAAPSFILRVVMLIGFGVLALGGSTILQWIGIAGAVAGMGDSGHALAVLPAGLGQGLMILHGLTAALWVGAIAPLRLALARDPDGATANLFRRFQTYGAVAMGGTLASGILLAVLLLPRLADLWQSDYGLRLSVKLAAVGVMVAIAATNRLYLTCRALACGPRARARLRLVLGLDVIAAALATVLAVGLSLGPPPAAAMTLAVANDRYDAALAITPGRVGDNDLSIGLTPKAGAPADPEEVEVRLSAPGIEPIARKAERTGTGRYQVQDLPLWVAGPWQIQLGLLIDDFTKAQMSTELTLTH